MASCVGVSSIWRSGSSKSSAYRSPSHAQPRAAAYGLSQALGAPRIMRKTRSRAAFKKTFSPSWRDRRKRGSWQADRDWFKTKLNRAEKQDHPPMGETRDTAFGAARSEDYQPYFRRHLPPKEKAPARPTLLHSEAMALHLEEISCGRTRAHALVLLDQAVACLASFLSQQHHSLAVAIEITRAQPSKIWQFMRANGSPTASSILRRHSRPLLLRLEQAHRYALENHLYRNPDGLSS